MSNIMITGSNGFLGKKLKIKLQHYNIFDFDICNGFDICNLNQVDDFIKEKKINIIIHLAAVADLNKFQDDCDLGHKINVEGTQNIIKVCEKFDIRLLFASTCCCYGNNNCHPSNEESPLSPTEPYAKSKMLSEEDLKRSKIDYVIMRLATFYGPGSREALAIYKFIDKIYNEEKIEIHGTGEQTRTYTHVEDIVGCIITILENKTKYNVINCTNTESISVLRVIKDIETILDKKSELEFKSDRKGQIFKEEIENNRVLELGYQFKYTWENGLNNMIKWYLKTKNYYIFLHPTKTGGTTVKKQLPRERFHNVKGTIDTQKNFQKKHIMICKKLGYSGKLHHFTLEQLVNTEIFTLEELKSLQSFVFVRNPYDRVVSMYHWYSNISNKKISFKDFIMNLKSQNWKNHLFTPQFMYVYYKNEKIVKNVLRFENFEKELKKFLISIGLTFGEKLYHEKKSLRSCYKNYYDEETKEIVFNKYKKDFEVFNYNKDF